MDSTEAGSQSEPQPQQQHQPSQEQQQTEQQQQQQQEDQQQQHQEQLSQQTHSQPLQQPVVASSTQASSQMDQSAISSSSPPSTSSMPCASPSSGGNSTQQAALQEQQQQPAQQTPSPQTPTSQQQQIQQQQQQQQQLQQQQQQQQQQQLHATQLHQALTSPSPAPQLTQMQPAQPQQAPTVQTQQIANHVQQLVSQQPSSTSMLAAICSSTSRMTSHISSPITTNTFVQSPSMASSPMTVSHSQGNSLISGQQMQLAQTSQMQVPVSTHITQNVNPHHTSTQQMSSLASQMSVSVSQIPQVQVIQQQPTTYHLQQLYHPSGQHMFLQPGNLTIQNMPTFHSSGGGLQLQLPTNTGGQMPISSVGNKTPIVSKGLAISSIASGMSAHQNQVMSSMKTGMNTGHQMIKPVMPSHQFAATNSHQIVIGPYGTVLPPTQQAILPANKAVLDVQKGKQFMLSHGTTIQPKTPLMPSTAMTSQFKTQLNASQLITQGAPATMIANQAQILSSFPALPQGLTWAAAPAGSLMGQNSSPIFIRGPGPQDLNFIQTSSPQLQTMSGNPIYVNQSGAVHMVQHGHASSTGNTAIAPSYITTTTAPTSQGTTNSTTTVQSVSLPAPVQHPPIAPAPAHAPQPPPTPTAIRPKPLRPATSVGTQTAPAVPQQKLPADSPVTKPVNSKTKTQLAKSTSTLLTKASSTTQTVPHQAPTQEIQTPNTQQANTTLTAQQITTKPFPTPSPFTAAGPFNQQMPNTASPSVTVPSTPMVNTAVSTTTATTQSTPVGRQTPTVNPHSPKVAPDSSLLKPTVTKKTTSQKSSGTQVGPTKTSVAVDTQTIPQMPLVPIASKSHVGPPNVAAKQMMMNHQSGESQSLMASPKPNTPPAKPCLKEKLNSLPSASQTVPAKPRVEKKDAATEHNPDVINFYPPEILKTPPQKAIVKPQVLTHLIDGFVLHESYKPFPVNGNYNDTNGDSPVKRDDSVFASSNNGVNGEGNIRIQCVNCHKTVPKTRSKAKKGKRFCSAICSRQFVSKNTKMGLFNPVKSTLLEFEHPTSESSASPRLEIDATVEGNGDAPDDRKRMKMSKRAFANPASHETSASKNESVTQTKEPMKVNGEAAATTCPDPPESALSEDNSPSSIAGVYIPASGKNPIKWSVQDVYDFVKNLPGCQEYADEFRSQEIDGQALMLLKEDHLMSAMSMKLGPALKICSKINALKEKADSNKS